MPIDLNRIKRFIERLEYRGKTQNEIIKSFETKKASPPPSVPKTLNWSKEEMIDRIGFLKEQNIEINYLTQEKMIENMEGFKGNIENLIGFTKIPTGIAGPLRITGLHADGDFYIPLATTEGALIASISRGCSLITKAGGAKAFTLVEGLSRAPVFTFDGCLEASLFSKWCIENFEVFKIEAAKTTRHGVLVDIQPTIIGNTVHLICTYVTGDASGQNMVTIATDSVLKYINKNSPITPKLAFIEGNLSGDKKPTSISFINGRGKKVVVECKIPRELVLKFLHTKPETIFEYWKNSIIGGIQSGSIGVQGHYANAITAIFIACGQDAACVSEATVGVTTCEVTEDGGLYMAVTLPNLIVGSVGGGTSCPTQKECLQILGCVGAEKANKFAEICASTVLAGELSIMGAMASGEFSMAHQMLGRKNQQ